MFSEPAKVQLSHTVVPHQHLAHRQWDATWPMYPPHPFPTASPDPTGGHRTSEQGTARCSCHTHLGLPVQLVDLAALEGKSRPVSEGGRRKMGVASCDHAFSPYCHSRTTWVRKGNILEFHQTVKLEWSQSSNMGINWRYLYIESHGLQVRLPGCIKAEHLPYQWSHRGDHWHWQLWPSSVGWVRTDQGTWLQPPQQKTPNG